MFLYRKLHLIATVVSCFLIVILFSVSAFANVTITLKGNVVDKSCELDYSSATIDVEMDQWNKTKAWTNGYVFGERKFNVLLSKCGETANFATFKFVDSSTTSDSNHFSVGSEVKGVALQLTNSEGNVINQNSNVTVKLSPKQSNLISFGAHYVVISDSITTGKTTSKVYFYIEYP